MTAEKNGSFTPGSFNLIDNTRIDAHRFAAGTVLTNTQLNQAGDFQFFVNAVSNMVPALSFGLFQLPYSGESLSVSHSNKWARLKSPCFFKMPSGIIGHIDLTKGWEQPTNQKTYLKLSASESSNRMFCSVSTEAPESGNGILLFDPKEEERFWCDCIFPSQLGHNWETIRTSFLNSVDKVLQLVKRQQLEDSKSLQLFATLNDLKAVLYQHTDSVDLHRIIHRRLVHFLSIYGYDDVRTLIEHSEETICRAPLKLASNTLQAFCESEQPAWQDDEAGILDGYQAPIQLKLKGSELVGDDLAKDFAKKYGVESAALRQFILSSDNITFPCTVRFAFSVQNIPEDRKSLATAPADAQAAGTLDILRSQHWGNWVILRDTTINNASEWLTFAIPKDWFNGDSLHVAIYTKVVTQ